MMVEPVKRAILPIYFALCLLMGGASNGGFLENLLLQLLGLAIATSAVMQARRHPTILTDRSSKWLAALLIAIVVIQFIPLPLAIWSELPGRTSILEELALVDVVPALTLVTLSLHETITSAVWILPAMGFGLALALRPRPDLDWLAIALVACAFAGIGLGLIQFSGPKDSPAYLYSFTNNGLLVGFFSNANHMATLLLVTFPFLAAVVRFAIDAQPQRQRELTFFAIVLAAFVLLGLGLVGSLTGYALALPVLVMSALIIFPGRRRSLVVALVPALIAGAVLIALTEEGGNVFAKDNAFAEGGRQQIFSTAWEATRHYWPVGSGLGTFREVYDDFENASSARPVYVNHAHNDYLEIVLEFGLLGVLAILAFAAWWVSRILVVWRLRQAQPFARAAAIASGVILLHSAWDYPLRTAAISTVFAMCCVILARTSEIEKRRAI